MARGSESMESAAQSLGERSFDWMEIGAQVGIREMGGVYKIEKIDRRHQMAKVRSTEGLEEDAIEVPLDRIIRVE